MVGNLVDHTIKNKKIEVGESSTKPKKDNFVKKNEGETQALFQGNQPNQSRGYTPYKTHSNYQPNYPSSNNQASFTQAYYPPNNQSNNLKNSRGPRPEKPCWDPILVSYTELLPQLIQSQLLAHTPLDPLIPPYP